jgi:hypothetical protein
MIATIKLPKGDIDAFDTASRKSVYNDFLVSAKIGVAALIKTKTIGIAVESQMRVFLSKGHFDYQLPASFTGQVNKVARQSLILTDYLI